MSNFTTHYKRRETQETDFLNSATEFEREIINLSISLSIQTWRISRTTGASELAQEAQDEKAAQLPRAPKTVPISCSPKENPALNQEFLLKVLKNNVNFSLHKIQNTFGVFE